MMNFQKTRCSVNGACSNNFLVQLGLHQDSLLSPLLFAIALEAGSRKIWLECPKELLYPDNFILVSEKNEGLKGGGGLKLGKKHWSQKS